MGGKGNLGRLGGGLDWRLPVTRDLIVSFLDWVGMILAAYLALTIYHQIHAPECPPVATETVVRDVQNAAGRVFTSSSPSIRRLNDVGGMSRIGLPNHLRITVADICAMIDAREPDQPVGPINTLFRPDTVKIGDPIQPISPSFSPIPWLQAMRPKGFAARMNKLREEHRNR